MGATVDALLDKLHAENCLVCSPDCQPNADSFVNGLYDLFTERPRLRGLLTGAYARRPRESEAD